MFFNTTVNRMLKMIHSLTASTGPNPKSRPATSLALTHFYPVSLSMILAIIRKFEDTWCGRFTIQYSRHPTFQCSSDAGAVLALPRGAIVYEAQNRADLRAHASRHALDWYEHVLNDGVDISNGSVYFVTECTKSVDWGIGVFYARSTAYHTLRFTFDGESYQWDYRGKVEARTGSNSADITASDGAEPNQCVFLGGFKIMVRPEIWDKLKMTSMASYQYGGLSSSQTSGSRTDTYYQSTSDNRNASDPSQRLLQTQHEGGSAKTAETASNLGQVILEDFFHEPTPVWIFFLWSHPSSANRYISYTLLI